MPRRKINNNRLSRCILRKSPFEDLPLKTLRVTIYALKWVFLLIFLFISVGIIALLITGGEENVQTILTYSITGFFTFFMGYFGWILAQFIINKLKVNNQKNVNGILYYFRKKD